MMMHRGLVLIAMGCSFLVIVSFALFARDQLAGASKNQQNQLAAGPTTEPYTPGVVPPATHHGQPRRFIDGAAHALTSPFRSIVESNSGWVTHGLPTLIALFVYGVGLGYLARFSRGLH
jgi:hypothetical protein